MTTPQMIRIRQDFKTRPIQDIPRKVRSELARLKLREIVRPGESVAITAGSRGITKFATVLAVVGKVLKEIGAKPFIVPAMGSHGGATAEGQRRILEKYDITEERTGVPIRSSMESVKVGATAEGLPVFMDRNAAEANHIVVVNRVKPHTDFKAPIESGLMKMMAIGLGKQKGADSCHNAVLQYGYYPIILSVGREIIKRCPIAFGLAVVENQKDETAIIEAALPHEIEVTDRRLLRKAKKILPRIPLDPIHLLIVDRIGKDVSGTGMDQNVICRSVIPFHRTPSRPKILRIFVRDLTVESDGNAVGIGNADFTTRRLVEKIDRHATYMNCFTANAPEMARIPTFFDTDREAIDAALKTLGNVTLDKARIVHISDTLRLEEMEISAAMVSEAEALDHVRMIDLPRPMQFDADGNLISDLLVKRSDL